MDNLTCAIVPSPVFRGRDDTRLSVQLRTDMVRIPVPISTGTLYRHAPESRTRHGPDYATHTSAARPRASNGVKSYQSSTSETLEYLGRAGSKGIEVSTARFSPNGPG